MNFYLKSWGWIRSEIFEHAKNTAKLNSLQAKLPIELALISCFFSVKRMSAFDSIWTGH